MFFLPVGGIKKRKKIIGSLTPAYELNIKCLRYAKRFCPIHVRFLSVLCPLTKWRRIPDDARENRLEWVEDCLASAKKVVGIPYKLIINALTLISPTGFSSIFQFSIHNA
ncbi:hypothetical protein EZS27_026243 [termite gut metagenome]|uniref:Uncharacterized protein n=1 Tax=termite gut metagenome TaxID=433724 RepID=A0A5J4QRE8_9ZZZZ